MLNKTDIKYRLIAETLKQWRNKSEERALGEFILYLTGISLEEVFATRPLDLANRLESLDAISPNLVEEPTEDKTEDDSKDEKEIIDEHLESQTEDDAKPATDDTVTDNKERTVQRKPRKPKPWELKEQKLK